MTQKWVFGWVLQFLTSQSNHAHSGLHGGNYVHNLHYILMHETSTQRSVFERRLAKMEGENTFGRSCILSVIIDVGDDAIDDTCSFSQKYRDNLRSEIIDNIDDYRS